ncbi:MAG: biopolymer transporter ExbD, partial [Bdellovibrionales bacterium]|nr:biopolymer transporter ExbD [Bdellovibrionales bacterium]
IIPLIDVMFLLVAFFMGVSISMVMQKRSFVDLSPAETADTSMEEKDTFVLSVEAAALFFLNKERIELEGLSSLLTARARENPHTAVVINADRQARHEHVIEARDVVRRSGLHNVIFSVEPRE